MRSEPEVRCQSKLSRSPWPVRCLSAACLVAGIAGCESTDPEEPEEAGPAEGSAALVDANNFKSQVDLTIPIIPTVAGQDVTLNWAGFTTDMRCQAVADPAAGVVRVMLLRFDGKDQAAVTQMFEAGEIDSNQIELITQLKNEAPADTTAKISEFATLGGEPVVPATHYVADPRYVYALALQNQPEPGFGVRSVSFLVPSADSIVDQVSLGPACDPLNRTNPATNTLAFSANLTGVTPVQLSASATSWVVDWSQVTVDSINAPFDPYIVDGLMLAYYEALTLEQIQADFLNVENIWTNLWDLTIDGAKSADLAQAVERPKAGVGGGGLFTGFAGKTGGVWLMALTCSTCKNPTPLFMTVINPV